MDNSLYLKENFLKDSSLGHISDAPKIYTSWSEFLATDKETSVILSAPNHFEETFTTSNEINFSFRPASPLKDNIFRFEYYDYIDRFDRIDAGEAQKLVNPKTPLHIVDLIPDLSSETLMDSASTGLV